MKIQNPKLNPHPLSDFVGVSPSPLEMERGIKGVRWILVIALSFILCSSPLSGRAYAEAKAEKEKHLTKGEVIALISATDFMKKKISELLSWSIGYDITAVNRVKLVPTFKYISALPKEVPPDGRTVLELRAKVDDPGGIANIVGVRADLTSIGKLPNMSLVDNGLFGDLKAGDGVYTLQASVSPRTTEGPKDVPVAAVNKKGWMAMGGTTLDIKKNPTILEIKTNPPSVPGGTKTAVTMFVKIDNPGRIEDVRRAALDLSSLGYSKKLFLRNDGKGGDAVAGDDTFSVTFVVAKGTPAGSYRAVIEVMNLADGYALEETEIKVY